MTTTQALAHHSAQLVRALPNGNFAVLGFRPDVEEVALLGWRFDGRDLLPASGSLTLRPMVSDRIYEAAKNAAVVFEANWLGTIAVRGTDRVGWLNAVLTSDVTRVRPGVAAYGLALVKVGRIIADLWTTDAGGWLAVGADRERIAALLEHFDRYLIMEDAELQDRSAEFQWVFAHGPRAASVAREQGELHGGFGGSVDITGLGGGVMVVPKDRAGALMEDLAALPGVACGSAEDWDALRLECFVPRFGLDFGEKNYPQEAALEKTAISFTKGCYLGQEVVCRLETRGHVSKRLAPIQMAGDTVPAAGVEVRAADVVVGRVSSAFMSRRLGAPVALAILQREAMEPGSRVQIDGREGLVLPLLSPNQQG